MSDLTPGLTVSGASIRWPASERWIGDRITFDADVGETILLLGPSGCGKSTLLLALSGLIPASIDAELRGTILCAGIDTSAKEVCMRCPVRAECAAHALAVREPYGVWGG
ncbi:WhiB family transcriptional regulator, partial [Streptomyces sp. NPDC000405]|uniref:WhiB family transcriptional regulator n=1 Tax=Streptomyces sp. NPDC000405 TaxID=3161033 RepID=UPI00398D62BD